MQRPLRELAQGASVFVSELVGSANARYRAALLQNEYRSRRRHYEIITAESGNRYDDRLVDLRTKERMHLRGLAPGLRSSGDVHTLAFFPNEGWHSQLLEPLRALGPLSHFDARISKVPYSSLLAGAPVAVELRRNVCEEFEGFARQAAAKRAVDWVFIYAPGSELLVSTIGRVRETTRAPIVGMCLDDKQSWQGPIVDGQSCGQVGLAPHIDLAWTSSRVACDWYLAEGGNPIYLPEGCDPDLFSPAELEPEFDMCFVGQAYGFRRAFVARLRALGLQVATAGPGWPEGHISQSDLIRLFRQSKVILGHGGIGWSEELKNTKGRDFDAPAVGMGAYLTSFSPELAEHFVVGREIACYSSTDECYEQARRLVLDGDLRRTIASAGRTRCVREHTWSHRFERILITLGVLPAPGSSEVERRDS